MEKKRILAGLLALAMTITFLGVIPVQAQQEDGIAAQWIAREELAAAGVCNLPARCSAGAAAGKEPWCGSGDAPHAFRQCGLPVSQRSFPARV